MTDGGENLASTQVLLGSNLLVTEGDLVTGSQDPQLRFHAAAIADASGDRQAAATHLGIVLSTNPRFSAALVDEAEALAERYGMTVPSPSVP